MFTCANRPRWRSQKSILAFEEDGQVTQYAGNWDNYRQQKRDAEKAAKLELRASQPPASGRTSSPPASQGKAAGRSKRNSG